MTALRVLNLLTIITVSTFRTSSSSTCSRLSVPEVLPANIGKILGNLSYLNLTANQLVVCGDRCMRQRKCKSINYDTVAKECTLNFKSHTSDPSSMMQTTNNNLKYFSVDQWPQDFMTTCRYHQCPEDKMCVSTPSGISPNTCNDDPDSTLLGQCNITSSCADCTEDRIHEGNTYRAVGCCTSVSRVLPTFIRSFRENIDWTEGAVALERIINNCAELTSNYQFFGIQFYGECWAGNLDDSKFPPSEIPISQCSKCNSWGKGVGSSNVMFVYRWV